MILNMQGVHQRILKKQAKFNGSNAKALIVPLFRLARVYHTKEIYCQKKKKKKKTKKKAPGICLFRFLPNFTGLSIL